MAAGLYRQQGHRAWLGWTLPFLAHALALNGRPDEAEAALAEHEVQALRIERLRAQAWVAVARDDLGTAHARLREAIELACHRGESAVECSVLHDRLRLGRAADASARLMELAGVVEGPLAAAQALHARSYRRDPAGLEAASAAFEELGALLLAAEAAADAAVAWRKAGDPRRASAAERRAHALADRCEGARTPALAAVSARAALTTRELEIARLAAAGVPNKEIAERLFLSLHTVQNKLHAAYEKLGIQGRAELADALDGT
jgi:DNA-binding CsgD family transcriptional regulator